MMRLKIRYFFKKRVVLIFFSAIVLILSFWWAGNFTIKLVNKFLIYLDFVPKNFIIEGNKVVNDDYIKSIIYKTINLNKKHEHQLNIFYLSPSKIRYAIKKNSNWISDVTVIRKIPNTFLIKVDEYVPFAVWNNKLVVDINNNVINDQKFISKMNNKLIQVKSNSVDSFISFILPLKNNIELMNNIKSLEHIGSRRWNIIFKTGLTIKLPESAPQDTLLKLIKSDKNIFTNKDIKVIDITVKGKTFITE